MWTNPHTRIVSLILGKRKRSSDGAVYKRLACQLWRTFLKALCSPAFNQVKYEWESKNISATCIAPQAPVYGRFQGSPSHLGWCLCFLDQKQMDPPCTKYLLSWFAYIALWYWIIQPRDQLGTSSTLMLTLLQSFHSLKTHQQCFFLLSMLLFLNLEQ
jgi:hypothetical protein